jgi:hypothetical protein
MQALERVVITGESPNAAAMVLDADGSVFENRRFRNHVSAIEWALSWGLPIETLRVGGRLASAARRKRQRRVNS